MHYDNRLRYLTIYHFERFALNLSSYTTKKTNHSQIALKF